MNRLERIQRISGVLRYLLLLAAAALAVAFTLAMQDPGHSVVILGDGQLNELRSSGLIGSGLMWALIAPIGIVLALGIYWLQRLFSEYQRGHFFTDANMRCYVWLVWLKVAAFIYSILWPVVLMMLASPQDTADVAISIEAGTLVELVVLLLIVYLLKEAQQIHDENKAFV